MVWEGALTLSPQLNLKVQSQHCGFTVPVLRSLSQILPLPRLLLWSPPFSKMTTGSQCVHSSTQDGPWLICYILAERTHHWWQDTPSLIYHWEQCKACCSFNNRWADLCGAGPLSYRLYSWNVTMPDCPQRLEVDQMKATYLVRTPHHHSPSLPFTARWPHVSPIQLFNISEMAVLLSNAAGVG